MSSTGAKVNLNDNETKLLASAWHCMKKAPEVDTRKLAVIMGHTNHNSTHNALVRVLKKLDAYKPSDGSSRGEDGASNDAPPPKDNASATSGKGTKRKAEQAVKNEPEASDNDNETAHDEPKPKKRAVTKGKNAETAKGEGAKKAAQGLV